MPTRPSCVFALQFAEEIHQAHKGTAPVRRACGRCGGQRRLDAVVVTVDGRSRSHENSGRLCASRARPRIARNTPATPQVAHGPARELLQRAALPRRPEGLDRMADAAGVAATSAVEVERAGAGLRVGRVSLVRVAWVRATLRAPVRTRTRDEHFRVRSRPAPALRWLRSKARRVDSRPGRLPRRTRRRTRS